MILPIEIFTRHHAQIFLVNGEQQTSFGLFLVRANQLAQKIRQSGASRVCVISDQTADYFYVLMASLLSGNAVIPIAPDSGTESRDEILGIVEPDLILDSEQIHREIDTYCDFDVDGREWHIAIDTLARADLHKEFLITFTSGTTAVPKGVVHSFANLWKTALSFGACVGLKSALTFYHHFPIAYMAGILNQFILPLAFGCKVVVGPRFEPKVAMDFWSEPIRTGATVFWMSPTMLQLLMVLDRGDAGVKYCLNNEIRILCGTAPLLVALRRKFEEKYRVAVYESYGLTETLFISTNSPRYPVIDGCSGKILDGVEAKLAEDGELNLRCDWMFLRYFNAESVVERDGIFHTGDIASIDSESGLSIIGRKKDLIIKGGINVSPGRIERLLDSLGRLSEFSVFGRRDATLGEKVVLAYVSETELAAELRKEINTALASRLDAASVIDEFVRLDALPKTANGKVDKKRLKEL